MSHGSYERAMAQMNQNQEKPHCLFPISLPAPHALLHINFVISFFGDAGSSWDEKVFARDGAALACKLCG